MNYISQQEPNQMWIKKVLMLVDYQNKCQKYELNEECV